MTSVTQAMPSDSLVCAAGGFAIVSGIISTIGVVFLIAMFALFATPLMIGNALLSKGLLARTKGKTDGP